MGLGLVMRGVMSVPGSPPGQGVRVRVVSIVGRRRAGMGKQRKESLSAHPVVNHHVHGGEKKRQKNPTAHEAHHG